MFTVKKPVWEVLYAGRDRHTRRGKAWLDRYNVVVWGGPNHVPNATRVLVLAVDAVCEALLPIQTITVGGADTGVEIPGVSELKFTMALVPVAEAGLVA